MSAEAPARSEEIASPLGEASPGAWRAVESAVVVGLALWGFEMALRLGSVLPTARVRPATLPIFMLLTLGLIVGATAIVGSAQAAVVVGLGRLLRRPRLPAILSHPVLRIATFATVVGLGGVSAFVLPSTYLRSHLAVDLALLVTAQVAWLAGARARIFRWGRLRLPAAALVIVLAACGLDHHPGVAAVHRSGLISQRVARALDWVFDVDRDGYPARWWLRGSDCADGDAARGPHMAEIVGNGIDDNCLAGDAAAPGPAPAPAAKLPPGPTAPARARNLVLITLCTLRDYTLDHTDPSFAELRSRALAFTRNRAQAPSSFVSLSGAFAGRFYHELHRRGLLDAWAEHPAQSEMLKDVVAGHGFRTAFFHRGLAGRKGAWRSLLSYPVDVSEGDRVGAALDWIETAGEQRFMLWFHVNHGHAHRYDFRPDPWAHESRRAHYLDGRRRDEAEVDALVRGLAEAGALESTAVLLFSDHGEALGEHVLYFHGTTLYEEMIRTPLLLYVPGEAPRSVSAATSNVDVYPTALALLGLPAAADRLGRDLVAVAHGTAPPMAAVAEHIDTSGRLAARAAVDAEGRWKLIVGFRPSTRELYDLARDPTESTNLWAPNARPAQILLGALERVDQSASSAMTRR